MHVNADWALLEVVDDKNQPVPAGETGAKVLVTNLANHVQPIVRYEVGDIVVMATESCNCGSNMPLIERIEGRDSDIFYIETKEGKRALQPTVFELALGRMLDAREYQIIQEENTKFRVLIEPLPGKKLDRAGGENHARRAAGIQPRGQNPFQNRARRQTSRRRRPEIQTDRQQSETRRKKQALAASGATRRGARLLADNRFQNG